MGKNKSYHLRNTFLFDVCEASVFLDDWICIHEIKSRVQMAGTGGERFPV